MTTTKSISPILAVADMSETIAFYQAVLGFDIEMRSDEYSILSRDGATIHLTKAADQEVLRCVRGHTEIYIEVSEIHTLWNHVSGMQDRYKVRGLIEQPYGMTEFHIADPNDCLVFVGQPSTNNEEAEQAADGDAEEAV